MALRPPQSYWTPFQGGRFSFIFHISVLSVQEGAAAEMIEIQGPFYIIGTDWTSWPFWSALSTAKYVSVYAGK